MGVFPEGWPNCCPPSDATDIDGAHFRVVQSKNFDESDFRSQAELGKAIAADSCIRVGLSVYSDFNGAWHRTQLSPHLGQFVAYKNLQSVHGKAKAGKQTHVTWWPYDGIPRHEGFQIVEAPP